MRFHDYYYQRVVLMKKGKNNNLVWTLVSLAIAVLTVRMILMQSKDLSIEGLLSALTGANKVLLILGVISAGIFVWAEGEALKNILHYAGYRKSHFQNFIYSTSDIYFSAITPSATGGQPASAFFMMRDGIPVGVATATLILNLMMYTISIIILGLVSILISPGAFFGFGRFSKLLILAGFVGLTALSGFFLLILKKGAVGFSMLGSFIEFLYDKRIIREKEKRLARLEKFKEDYEICSDLIAGRKRVLASTLAWNLIQRTGQLIVPMFLYLSLGGKAAKAVTVFARQCLVTIGYNFVPIPGGMGISDYLMIDGFRGIMGDQMAYQLELLSRGITFYICVSVCGIITLFGYAFRRNKK